MSKAAYRLHRKKHVKLWQASGLSKLEYANQLGVSKDAFYDWLREFGTATAQQVKVNHSKTIASTQTKAVATLIPVSVQAKPQNSGFKLIRSDGIVLEWSEPPPATWLAELLRGIA